MYINNKEFKQIRINKHYFISKDGEVFSSYNNKLLRPMLRGKWPKQYLYVDIFFNGSQKHMPIHRLVYDTWVEHINQGENINHYDDNQFNNSLENLYKGTQKENIKDCFNNENRVGNIKKLIVYDYEKNKQLQFIPASEFIDYCGHPSKNGSIKKFFNKNWFIKRYKVIEYSNIHNKTEK